MTQSKKGIVGGVVPSSVKKLRAGRHTVPADWRKALLEASLAHTLWEDITPLARNEWICWILDAKKLETRQRRIEVGISKLKSGMRRPCCWAGCTHRSK